jgi:hypothetical protein
MMEESAIVGQMLTASALLVSMAISAWSFENSHIKMHLSAHLTVYTTKGLNLFIHPLFVMILLKCLNALNNHKL